MDNCKMSEKNLNELEAYGVTAPSYIFQHGESNKSSLPFIAVRLDKLVKTANKRVQNMNESAESINRIVQFHSSQKLDHIQLIRNNSTESINTEWKVRFIFQDQSIMELDLKSSDGKEFLKSIKRISSLLSRNIRDYDSIKGLATSVPDEYIRALISKPSVETEHATLERFIRESERQLIPSSIMAKVFHIVYTLAHSATKYLLPFLFAPKHLMTREMNANPEKVLMAHASRHEKFKSRFADAKNKMEDTPKSIVRQSKSKLKANSKKKVTLEPSSVILADINEIDTTGGNSFAH